MLETISKPSIRYSYIVQTPDTFDPDKEYQLIFYFHGSLNESNKENISRIYTEYETGRWIFSQKVNESCIFVTPVICRGNEVL